jgi:glycosyltransferase involved in cell wall biosynthesis
MATQCARIENFGPPADSAPLVSVAMITYRHEQFIAQALESVFAQQAGFAVELVVGEDASPDGTLATVRERCRHSPIPVKLVSGGANVGMHANFRRVLELCRGKYVALLEGDDYWVASDKIAKQVAALETQRSASLCYHQAMSLTDGEDPKRPTYGAPWPRDEVDAPLSFEHALTRFGATLYGPPTASVMFRRSVFPTLPAWIDGLAWADWPMFLSLLSAGSAVFLRSPDSVYRVHPGGISNSITAPQYHRDAIKVYLQMRTVGNAATRRMCVRAAVDHAIAVAETTQDPSLRTQAAVWLRHLLQFAWRYPPVFRRASANLLKIRRPRLYAAVRRWLSATPLASR